MSSIFLYMIAVFFLHLPVLPLDSVLTIQFIRITPWYDDLLIHIMELWSWPFNWKERHAPNDQCIF